VDGLAPGFCFYDDPDLPEGEDADRWSSLLQRAHQQLWSKRLPTGQHLELGPDLEVARPDRVRGLQLSSDTIASTHQRYRHRGIDLFWEALTFEERERYDRGFYTIGGFIVFPRRPGSLNQRRGTSREIDDRFDLTLECIRLYYEGLTTGDRNPLGDVLLVDKDFFDLFGGGAEGFTSYVEFFHLGGLVEDGHVRWFDEHDAGDRAFLASPLPKTLDAYVRFLDNVLAFVESRNGAIAAAAGLIG
jgi:hypothetical protein